MRSELLSTDCDDDQVKAVVCLGLADRGHRHHGAVPGLCVLQDQPLRLQVDQSGTAGKKHHLMTGLQQLAGVHAADHSSPEHKNPQPFSSLRP